MFAFLNVHKYYVLCVHVFNMFQFFRVYSDFCVGTYYTLALCVCVCVHACVRLYVKRLELILD